jgi:Arc/MetJ family transcription regulator
MARAYRHVDDQACAVVMHRFNLASKQDAVNDALRRLADESMHLERARAMRGTGWEGDLSEMRQNRVE